MADGRHSTRITARMQRLWDGVGRAVRYRTKRGLQRLRATNRHTARRRVFVAGVQRSGTNMLMDALDRSRDTDVYHETDPRAFDDYEMRAPEVIADLIRRSPAPVFVIKALCELQELPELMERFESARTVWIYRDYRDVASSMTVSFKSIPDTVQRLAVEGDGAGWWGAGMSPETHAFVRRVVADGPGAQTSAALLWYVRNRLFFDRRLDADPRVLVVRYEHLVTNPTAVIRQTAEFIGLPFTPRLSRGIHARSVGRRPEPDVDPTVAQACQGLMQAFENAQTNRAESSHGRAVPDANRPVRDRPTTDSERPGGA